MGSEVKVKKNIRVAITATFDAGREKIYKAEVLLTEKELEELGIKDGDEVRLERKVDNELSISVNA